MSILIAIFLHYAPKEGQVLLLTFQNQSIVRAVLKNVGLSAGF